MTSRTSLMTAAAIAGVLLAGTAAVAANIGILNAADSSAIGDLAATDELLPSPGGPTVTVASLESPTTTAAPTTTTLAADATMAAQQYDISDTATVWVLATRSGIALDHVVAEPGWVSALSQSDPRSLTVNFVNGGRTVVFTASLGDDGVVVVDVTEPTTVVGPPAAATAPQTVSTTPPATATYDDDRYEDDHDEEDEDDDHDDDEYDDDEYEGADDDD